MLKITILWKIVILFSFFSCKKIAYNTASENKYAKGFVIEHFDSYKLLKVFNPWKNANKTFTYLFISPKQSIPKDVTYNQIIRLPVSRVVATSTTQVAGLEILGKETSLVGFTGLHFVSSPKTRRIIDSNQVKELSLNGVVEGDNYINTERLISLHPDVVLGTSVSGDNRVYNNIIKSGIPVIYEGAWLAKSPLARAEWIKLIGALFNLEKKSDSIFNHIEKDYNTVKQLIKNVKYRPTILSGALYRDVWHVPSGESWSAQFFKDAGGLYLWKDIKGSGSISLNFESVLEKGIDADFWIGPNQYTSYQQLQDDYIYYNKFSSFKNKKTFTYFKTQGPTGGLIYYEEGPNRPDLILKDLIRILHPELLPYHNLYFYKPLEENTSF